MGELTREDIQKLTELTIDMKYIKETLAEVLAEQRSLKKEVSTLVNDYKRLSDKVDRLKVETASEISSITEKSTRFGRFMKANWYKIWIVGSSLIIVLMGWLADHLYRIPPPH